MPLESHHKTITWGCLKYTKKVAWLERHLQAFCVFTLSPKRGQDLYHPHIRPHKL